jgi:hypothetical protein
MNIGTELFRLDDRTGQQRFLSNFNLMNKLQPMEVPLGIKNRCVPSAFTEICTYPTVIINSIYCWQFYYGQFYITRSRTARNTTSCITGSKTFKITDIFIRLPKPSRHFSTHTCGVSTHSASFIFLRFYIFDADLDLFCHLGRRIIF